MQLESMYQEIILDHYRNPHHKGLLAEGIVQAQRFFQSR